MTTALTTTTTAAPALRPTSIPELWELAKGLAASKLFGYDSPDQAMMMMMVCEAEGRHPIEAARRYHIIKGRPSIKAEALLADYRKAGGRVRWLKREDAVVEAVFINPDGDESPPIRWDDARVRRAGLTGNHGVYPTQMKTARVISEGVGLMMPELKQGIHTQEELVDMERSESGQFVPAQGSLEPTSRFAPATVQEEAPPVSAPVVTVEPERPAQATPARPDFTTGTDLRRQLTTAAQAGDIDTVAGLLEASLEKLAAKPNAGPALAKVWSDFAPALYAANLGMSDQLEAIGCPRPVVVTEEADFTDDLPPPATEEEPNPFTASAPPPEPAKSAQKVTALERVEEYGKQYLASDDRDAAFYLKRLITEFIDLPADARARWEAIKRQKAGK